MTVGYHAPPPEARSGIAAYSETLRVALSRFGTVVADAATADVHLYQLGNNKLHASVYRRALGTPGVAVLHDASLHHVVLGTLEERQYLQEWVYNYGEWRRESGAELWLGRGRSASDPRYFENAMLRRIVERSRVLVVHNPGAAAIVEEAMRRAGVKRRIVTIPHFHEARELPSAADTALFRERLGIPQNTFLFGIFGYLREPKRVSACLRAFERLHAVGAHVQLLIAGECVSGDLARLLEAQKHPAILRAGRLSEKDLEIAIAAADCCLNLRFPGVGETSGIAIRAMAAGTPVIVTANLENSEFPESAVLRVRPGVAEAEELFDHMVLVTQFPALARQIGREGRLHILGHHSLPEVAQAYWNLLCEAASSPS